MNINAPKMKFFIMDSLTIVFTLLSIQIILSQPVSSNPSLPKADVRVIQNGSSQYLKSLDSISSLAPSTRDTRQREPKRTYLRNILNRQKISPLYLINGTVCRFINASPVCTTLSTTGLLQSGGQAARPAGGGGGGGGGTAGSSGGSSGSIRPGGTSGQFTGTGSSVQFASPQMRPADDDPQESSLEPTISPLDIATSVRGQQASRPIGASQLAAPLNLVVSRRPPLNLLPFRRPYRQYQVVGLQSKQPS